MVVPVASGSSVRETRAFDLASLAGNRACDLQFRSFVLGEDLRKLVAFIL